MRAVITGANGFIGSSLVKRMIDEGIEVLAIDLSFDKPNFPINKYVTTLESDLSNIEDVLLFAKHNRYDVFYHLAWRGVNGPDKTSYIVQTNNLITTLKCAELAHAMRCKKFLCAGTVAERAVESLPFLQRTSPGLMYAVAKHCTHLFTEDLCKSIGLDFVWMQFSNIYGPSNKTGNLIGYTLSCLQRGEEASFGPANQPYDFVYAEELIEAVLKLGINRTNKCFYYIGSGAPAPLSYYLLKAGTVFGRPDLIKIGQREDDGVKYSFDMFEIRDLVEDIGPYITGSFEKHIEETILSYRHA